MTINATEVSFSSCFLCWMIDFIVNIFFNVLVFGLAPTCASVNLRYLLNLFANFLSSSFMILFHYVNTSLLYFSNSFLTSSGPLCFRIFNAFVACFTLYSVVSLLYFSRVLVSFVRY